ncbi:hypothetical protein BDQ12DRAFT_675535 [Crucibulum laeve]|uniref:Uncharacterized protein n=1 Tax=Crucibulum laeve TaxID=68775 RepID=A0A5C3MEB3_9AGAR|nr:hypothetical protein BDQ12DRAFT_675535 [Crucibulum laeve]
MHCIIGYLIMDVVYAFPISSEYPSRGIHDFELRFCFLQVELSHQKDQQKVYSYELRKSTFDEVSNKSARSVSFRILKSRGQEKRCAPAHYC